MSGVAHSAIGGSPLPCSPAHHTTPPRPPAAPPSLPLSQVDMTALFELREKYKDGFEKVHGVKLGFMSPFIKAAAAALTEIPAVNAVIDGGDVSARGESQHSH